jgi:hypothetical protein
MHLAGCGRLAPAEATLVLRDHDGSTLGDDHRVFVQRRQVSACACKRPPVKNLGDDTALGRQEWLMVMTIPSCRMRLSEG